MSSETVSTSMSKDDGSLSKAESPSPPVSQERGTINTMQGLPRLPIDLHERKISIGIHWFLIFLPAGILPLVLYFSLKYCTGVSLKVIFATFLPLNIVMPLLSLCERTYKLTKADPIYRPLGQTSRWALDYFQWNFAFGFVLVTVFICVGEAVDSVVIVSLPTTLLLVYVCAELLLVELLMAFKVPAFARFSSIARGEQLRPGAYIIAEDIVAVDGGVGLEFRQAWQDRYDASKLFRAHLRKLDVVWGTTGLAVVAGVWGTVFGVENKDIGFGLGWGLPWLWAGCMTLWTFYSSKMMLREEKREFDAEKQIQGV